MKKRKLKLHQYPVSRIERITRRKKIICFGSGNNLTYVFGAMQDLQMEDRIRYIADNDAGKWGKDRILNGKHVRIENPEKLRNEDWSASILLITIVAYQSILRQLEELLQESEAICLISPAYRYWYDRFLDKVTLRQPLRNVILLQGEGDTCENAKALMRAFRREKSYSDYRIAWLYDGVEHGHYSDGIHSEKYFVRDLPLKVHTPRQMYSYGRYINRARFQIYENKMLPKVRDEQIACYMNHGVPLKSTKGKIVVYKDTDYVLSPSKHAGDIICEQYDADKSQITICGAPRTDCFFHEGHNRNLADFLQIERYKKMILWAPTFRVHENYSRRDSEKQFCFGIPLLECEKDYQELLRTLQEKNILLIIKPHIHEELSELTMREADHILIVKQNVLDGLGSNVYDLMKLSGALITDYSSIGFDYLLLDRPLGYTIDDMEQYTIGFSVPDPLAYMPGMKMSKMNELLEFVDAVSCDQDKYADERKKLRDKLHTYQDGNNSERLLQILGLV